MATCTQLKALNLGFYKSAEDLGEIAGNFYDDQILPDLENLLLNHPSLEYLNLSRSKISKEGLLTLPRLPHLSIDFGSLEAHHVHDKDQRRLLKQPKRVVHIDSIYRNNM